MSPGCVFGSACACPASLIFPPTVCERVGNVNSLPGVESISSFYNPTLCLSVGWWSPWKAGSKGRPRKHPLPSLYILDDLCLPLPPPLYKASRLACPLPRPRLLSTHDKHQRLEAWIHVLPAFWQDGGRGSGRSGLWWLTIFVSPWWWWWGQGVMCKENGIFD